MDTSATFTDKPTTFTPLHGRAMALPLSLTRRVARTFAEHPFACIARTDDGRPIILAHDVPDRRRLLDSLPNDAAEHISVHAGHYVDDHGQVLQPAKGQYILLAAGGGPAAPISAPNPRPASVDRDCLLVGFRPAGDGARSGSYDITGRYQIIELDDPDDPGGGTNFADARARADRLIASGDYWAVAVRRRDDPARRWAYFATESGAPATLGASK